MNLAGSAYALAHLAQGGEHVSEHSFSPFVIGGFGLGVLFLLLFLTTRFNRDR
ncbi:hypothetical protein JGS22_015755 [Streptomyces sp. P38-E01]|uniref:Uncharacterized protein n=1 Tax=Streptomyces tardus TaxID=2780544 RepID=A0A949JI51_9ACTN|nr:hypothetical protein [Streptomyces tardus]MBU7599024.1 hypothetical protein [Streptomyces tardus]